jgi:serine/threonine-protein kinase
MSFTVGETVGAYRIVSQLGQGGMATVFKAYQAALDRYVALKVMHPAFSQDSDRAKKVPLASDHRHDRATRLSV